MKIERENYCTCEKCGYPKMMQGEKFDYCPKCGHEVVYP